MRGPIGIEALRWRLASSEDPHAQPKTCSREVPSRGYHFWAVYTKVSRLYPKSQVTCHNI